MATNLNWSRCRKIGATEQVRPIVPSWGTGPRLPPEPATPTGPLAVPHDAVRGLTYCRLCGAEVVHRELADGTWSIRDTDGLPHKLTCPA